MKKTLSMITLAVLSVGLLGSCLKINERLDNLDRRVDVIENEKIATINGQIDGIKSSIADLGQIRSDISNLKQTAEAHGEDIFALQEADETLGNRIDNLEDYLDNVLPTFAEKEWVEATYSTLEQYDSTCTAIAEINVRIGELDARLSKDIKDCADSLTKWINVKFEGYYTAAQMDAKLAQMKAAIDSAKAAGRITDAKADSIAAELTKTKTAVDTAKSNIRKEYKAAIKTAIDSTEGKLTKKIQDEIEKVNDRIDLLAGQVTNLNNAVIALAGRVDALEKMIQSVTIVPSCADGGVKIDNDIFTVNCIISPASAATKLKKKDFKILLNKFFTKSVSFDTVNIADLEITKDGKVSIRADIYDYIPAGQDSSLTVAVNVKDGTSDYTTEFVNVKGSYSYVKITAKYNGDDKPATTLKWAKENLAITASGKKSWKGVNPSAVKVPGTKDDVIVGDYFQWAASYNGYNVTENKKPDSLLIYTEFSNKCCGDSEDKFTFRSAGEGKTYHFDETSNSYNNIGISPYWSDSAYNKYNTDSKTVLERIPDNDDVASIILGGNWRMPTSAEFKAMKAATYWKWDETDKGYYVYAPQSGDEGKINDEKVAGHTYNKSDALLFFPAAGSGDGTALNNEGCGNYWSSSLCYSGYTYSYFLIFESGYVNPQRDFFRSHGFSVRPVSE